MQESLFNVATLMRDAMQCIWIEHSEETDTPHCSHSNGFIICNNFFLLFFKHFGVVDRHIFFLRLLRAMYPNDIRFEHHSFEWLKRLLTASWIAHISTLFSQIPWLKHRQNHVNRKSKKAKQKQTHGRIKRRWISWSKQKTCGNCVSLYQQLRMMPFNSQYTHAHTMEWLNWAKHSNQHGIFEYVMVIPHFFRVTTVILLHRLWCW